VKTRHHKYIRIGVIALIIVLNLGVLTYRYINDKRIPKNVYSGSQAERLETWNDMKRLSLSDRNISNFVNHLLESETLECPPNVEKIDYSTLTETQMKDINLALSEFFQVYRGEEADPVYDYLAVSRGNTTFIPEIKQSIETSVKKSNPSLTFETEKDLFRYVWNEGSKGIGWDSLLMESGQCCFWKINKPMNDAQSLHLVLSDEKMFRNRTTMPHVFMSSLELSRLLKEGKTILFGDIFFVTELNPQRGREFCATGVRFWFNKEIEKWISWGLVLVTPSLNHNIAVIF
jgi:hypothetical protein